MKRPLIVSDCDEVLLHMIVPFRDWLGEAHDIHFNMAHGEWGEALRHKHDGTQVETDRVWELLDGFFVTEMHRQPTISGAVEAIAQLSQIADIAILTNLQGHHRVTRGEQLRDVGIDAPVYTNQGGKGRALAAIIGQYDPSVTIFIDDLGHQHQSVAKHCPDVWRLHMVGEPLIAARSVREPMAHDRIDDWQSAVAWIQDKVIAGEPAPLLEEMAK